MKAHETRSDVEKSLCGRDWSAWNPSSFFAPPIHTLEDLTGNQVRELHYVESRIAQYLAEMMRLSQSGTLLRFLREEEQNAFIRVTGLEELAEHLKIDPNGCSSKVALELVDGGPKAMRIASPMIRDAVGVANYTRICHYRYAGYSFLCALERQSLPLGASALIGDLVSCAAKSLVRLKQVAQALGPDIYVKLGNNKPEKPQDSK